MSFHIEHNTTVLQRLIREYPDKVNEFLRAAAQDVVTDIKLYIQQSEPAGRTYLRGRVAHTASAPGQPPAIDTGALINSLSWYQDTPTRMIVHDGVEYGYGLEMGRDKVAPRPFVNPVIDQWKRRKFVQLAQEKLR